MSNVFYPRQTRGLKSIPTFEYNETVIDSMTVYFTEHFVYSICSEGALYSSPRLIDGSFDPTDWIEVDFAGNERVNGDVYTTMLTAIQDCLEVDAIHDPDSGYFRTAG